MKRLFLVIAVVLIISFTGCSTSADATLSFTNYEGYLLNNRPYHLIDNITGVVYVVVPTSHGCAITPAYNPDGSLLTKKQLEVKG